MFGWKIGARPVVATAMLAGIAVAMPARAQECVVKIGAVGPMSAGAAAYGLATKAATDFVAALYNEEGGLPMGSRRCTVQVIAYDDQYTAAGGAAASNYLASENVHITMGPVGSPDTTGFRPVGKRNGQINFSASYMANAITPEFPLAFHAYSAPATWGPILVAAAKEQFNFNSVMILGTNDQAGTDSGRQLAKMYAEKGVKPVEEYYQRGTTNFAPLAARVINANVDAIEIGTLGPADGRAFVKQLVEAGYKGVIGALGGVGPEVVIESAGGPDKLRAFYWLELSPVDDPGVIRMKADYARIMKQPPPDNGLFPVYTLAAEQALRAISLAQTDQDAEKLAATLRAMPIESRYLGKGGWRGNTIYHINQELAFPIGMGMIIDGKKVPSKLIPIPAEP